MTYVPQYQTSPHARSKSHTTGNRRGCLFLRQPLFLVSLRYFFVSCSRSFPIPEAREGTGNPYRFLCVPSSTSRVRQPQASIELLYRHSRSQPIRWQPGNSNSRDSLSERQRHVRSIDASSHDLQFASNASPIQPGDQWGQSCSNSRCILPAV